MRLQHRQQGRLNYWQHRPGMFCIYRTLIQQRLLIEFSWKIPTLYLFYIITQKVQTDIQGQNSSNNYQSMARERYGHVTGKSHDITSQAWSSLKRSRRTQGLEGSREVQIRVGVRDDVKGLWFLMVYTWCIHVQWRLRV